MTLGTISAVPFKFHLGRPNLTWETLRAVRPAWGPFPGGDT